MKENNEKHEHEKQLNIAIILLDNYQVLRKVMGYVLENHLQPRQNQLGFYEGVLAMIFQMRSTKSVGWNVIIIIRRKLNIN